MTRRTYGFTIAGRITVGDTTVRSALLPLIEEMLRAEIQEHGLAPVDDEAAVKVSSYVLAQAVGEMERERPDVLMKAYLERAVSRDLRRGLRDAVVTTAGIYVEPSGEGSPPL
ncbi:hypothetical protein [Geodermatophilus sp. DSM 44513]|uniref:hypothetical protein n=1 Tax=Geodermatophilus sp. DSM 44513 TaxID=1528104 RepID=UPI001289F24D|nr:hypothetical protein [Geodermatophilus sp. DSM 44513]WNV75241.1 hypothetical protein RTG05_19995 [Geodermatophilus sp. DSM 44513]